LRNKIEVLHANCAAIGRDPASIEVSVKAEADVEPATFAELAAGFREAGAQHIIAHFPASHDPVLLSVFVEHLTPVVG